MRLFSGFINKQVFISEAGRLKSLALDLFSTASKAYEHPASIRVRNRLFNSPAGLALIGLSICWLGTMLIYGPLYMANDDPYMRAVLENKFISGIDLDERWLIPGYMHPYLAWARIFLYDNFPGIYWYDLIWYFFLSISFFVTSFCLAERASYLGLKYKLIIVLGLPCLYGVSFIALQFSIISGLLTISAITAFLSFFWPLPFTHKKYIWRSVYIIAALSCAALLRANLSLVTGSLAFLLILPLLPWSSGKSLIAVASIPVFIGLVSMIFLMHTDQTLRDKNKDWKYWADYNKAFVGLVNDAVFSAKRPHQDFNTVDGYRHLTTEFNKLKAKGIDFDQSNDFIWSKDYYSLLLNFHYIGEVDGAFSLENINKVYDTYKEVISIQKNAAIEIRVDQKNWFYKYFFPVIFLPFIFRSKKTFFYTLYSLIVFMTFIAIMSIFFRAMPIRLWYGFVVLLFLLQLSSISIWYQYNKPHDSQKTTWIDVVLACLIILALYNTLYPQIRANRQTWHIYQSINDELQHLNPDNLYVLDHAAGYYMSQPFRPFKIHDLKLKAIYFCAYLHDPKLWDIYEKAFGLTRQDTLKNLLQRDDVRFLGIYNYSVFKDFDNLMRHRYDLEIGVVRDMPVSLLLSPTVLIPYKYVILNEEEKKFRRNNRNFEYISTFISPVYVARLAELRKAVLNKYIQTYTGEDIGLSVEAALSCVECFD